MNFERVLRVGEDTDPVHIKVITRLNLGETYRCLGRLAEAEQQLLWALDNAPEVNNQHVTAVALSNLACILRDLGRTHDALGRAGKALEILRPANDDVGLTYAHHAHATALADLGLLDDSLAELETALAVARRREAAHPETEILIALADVQRRRGQPQRATTLAAQARDAAQAHQFKALYGDALTILAALAIHDGQAEQGADLARQAMQVHEETGNQPGLLRAATILGQPAQHAR
jgi:tetratricopeptide (TPR) repeat protein